MSSNQIRIQYRRVVENNTGRGIIIYARNNLNAKELTMTTLFSESYSYNCSQTEENYY